MAMQDKVDTGKLAMVAVVGALVVTLVVVVAELLYYRLDDELQLRRNVLTTPRALRDYRAEQEEKLSTYRWVDQQAQAVAIPIERAMELTLQDFKDGKMESTALPVPTAQAAAPTVLGAQPTVPAQSDHGAVKQPGSLPSRSPQVPNSGPQATAEQPKQF